MPPTTKRQIPFLPATSTRPEHTAAPHGSPGAGQEKAQLTPQKHSPRRRLGLQKLPRRLHSHPSLGTESPFSIPQPIPRGAGPRWEPRRVLPDIHQHRHSRLPSTWAAPPGTDPTAPARSPGGPRAKLPPPPSPPRPGPAPLRPRRAEMAAVPPPQAGGLRGAGGKWPRWPGDVLAFRVCFLTGCFVFFFPFPLFFPFPSSFSP